MRIVRVCEQFPPAPGGLAPGMAALSQAQISLGHDLTVITRDTPGALAFDQTLSFPVIRVSENSMWRFGWSALRILKKMDPLPDVLHCHGPATVPFLMRRKALGIPIVVSIHAVRRYQYPLFREVRRFAKKACKNVGLQSNNLPSGYHALSKVVLKDYAIESYICRRATHMALVAEYFQGLLETYYHVEPDRYTVVYNGSSGLPSTEINAGEKCGMLTGLYSAPTVPLILYAGRLDWVKRVHLLIQALPMIRGHFPHARLVLVGRGDQKTYLEQLVRSLCLEDAAKIVDWMPHNELMRIYGMADCLCLPSYWEGLSKVILEAMSAKLPVIASRIPANEDALDGGRCGFLVSEASPEAWADTILNVLKNRDEMAERTKNGFDRWQRMYQWPLVAQRLDDVYARILGR